MFAASQDPQSPRATTDLAILDETAVNIRFQIDVHLFTAVGTNHDELIVHSAKVLTDSNPATDRSALDWAWRCATIIAGANSRTLLAHGG
jgi:hypothetical protein